MHRSNPAFTTENSDTRAADNFPIDFSDSSEEDSSDEFDMPKLSLFPKNWVNADMYQQFGGSILHTLVRALQLVNESPAKCRVYNDIISV